MSESGTNRVEIDDRVRAQPELMTAATQATAYLESRIRGVPPPERIRWGMTPSDPSFVELSMSDSPTFADGVSRRVPVTSLRDPAQRDIWMLRVWGDLLDERSRTSRAKLDAMLREYAREYGAALELSAPDNV